MSPPSPGPDRTPSALWLWGFWTCFAGAVAVYVLSLSTPPPIDRVLLAIAGALLLIGGIHQSRVLTYKGATRAPYSTYGPNSYLLQRQMGWSAVILGVVVMVRAVLGL